MADTDRTSRLRRRLPWSAAAVAVVAAGGWCLLAPGPKLEFVNDSGGPLREVVFTFPDGEVALGVLPAGGRKRVAGDVREFRYRAVRADGSRVDEVGGFSGPELLSRVSVRVTPDNTATDYEHTAAVRWETRWLRLRRWLGW